MTAIEHHRRDVKLEAIRGIAACSVMVWHCLVAFFPYETGLFPELGNNDGVTGRIWFGMISGGGAVTLFFVLSAYVLTRSYLLDGDTSILMRGTVKRWPRLAGPVVISTLVAWALFRLGLMFFYPASAVSQSPWLKLYAYGLAPDRVLNFTPNLWYAFHQGAYGTFFIGTDNSLNNNMWTMHYEFIGSFISYGLALILFRLRDARAGIPLYVIAVVVLLVLNAKPYMAAFPMGAALAFYAPRKPMALPLPLSILALLGSIYLIGYEGQSNGAYAYLDQLLKPVLQNNLVQVIGAMIAIFVVENSIHLGKALSTRFFAWLGYMSFPIYLMHLIVIGSLGSFVLLRAGAAFPSGSVAPRLYAFVATIIASFIVAIPVARANHHWTRWINRAVVKLLGQVPRSSKPDRGQASMPSVGSIIG